MHTCVQGDKESHEFVQNTLFGMYLCDLFMIYWYFYFNKAIKNGTKKRLHPASVFMWRRLLKV